MRVYCLRYFASSLWVIATKAERLMPLAAVIIAVLWAGEGGATSIPRSAECRTSHFEENVKNAKHIIVARLENYLPDNEGEYRVLMNLRGDIQPGTRIKLGTAACKPPNPDGTFSPMELCTPLGYNAVYLVENYKNDGGYLKLVFSPCDWWYSASFKDEHGRPGLDPIINYILEGKFK